MRGLGVLGVAVLVATIAGCNGGQRYMGAENGGIYQLAMTETTPPYFMSTEAVVYLIEQRIPIVYREPTQAEMDSWADISGVAQPYPYPRLPYVQRDQVAIQVDWTLSSVEPPQPDNPDANVRATVVINGINEFTEYVPGIHIVDRELVIDFSQNEYDAQVPVGGRLTQTIRQEELDEVEVDLATVVNGGEMQANQIVFFANQSAFDERAQPFIPQVVPALMGIRIGLRVEGDIGQPPPPLLLETSVRVTDHRGVLAAVGDPMPYEPPAPAVFTPPAPMPM